MRGDSPQGVDEEAGEKGAILLIELLKGAVGLGRLPDVAHHRFVVEHLVVAVDDTAQRRMQIPRTLHRGEVAADAVFTDKFLQ